MPKGKAPQLVGQKFGKLTVIERASTGKKYGEVHWKCQCDCGNTCFPATADLLRATRSCGCTSGGNNSGKTWKVIHKGDEVKWITPDVPLPEGWEYGTGKPAWNSGRSRYELRGVRFGKWLVVSDFVAEKGWPCRCDCGAEHFISTENLLSKTTRSCSCWERKPKKTPDNLPSSWPEYTTWCDIRSRCCNPKNQDYEDYGGRGIRVSEKWLGKDGFKNFISDVGRKPLKGLSLDRIEVNGNYEPGNVRWATWVQQANNRRPRKKRQGGFKLNPQRRIPDVACLHD